MMKRNLDKVLEVKCPYCGKEIDDSYVRSQVAKQLGASRSPRKKKSPEEMSKLGKKGAAKRWKKKA